MNSPSNSLSYEQDRVSFAEATRVWMRIAALSFGGPAGQIAVMHRILVEEKRWIGESRFLHALNYCMLLPGPEAMQLATYFGWLLHGVRGGLVAGCLFVLPGFLSILALCVLYASFQEASLVQAIFFGIKAAVLAIVIEALLRIGKRALKTWPMYLIAASAFVAIFVFDAPFPLIIAMAALVGFLGGRFDPGRFLVIKAHETPDDEKDSSTDAVLEAGGSARIQPTWHGALRTALTWGSIWAAPIIVLLLLVGPDHVFTQLAVFFSKLAVMTFGGAYAVLAYMAQEAVQTHGWLAPGEMLDGLGMAETTPGPLIQVVQFVGFLGGYRDAGMMGPVASGVVASVIVTWVTFAPCFLWIFLGAPFIEKLRGVKLLTAALSAVTAAVVGVILNLAIWFALHVVFARLDEVRGYGASLLVPDISSIDIASVVIAAASLVAMLRFKVGMLTVLLVSAAVGAIYYLGIAAVG
ncbi:chromate efflux transporter [Qipengyuania sp. XHP0207]|uniref:chromate efflux transporter n=2 Tax=Erythrobacteraceae TaxID=335929 RepID=UPI001C98E8C9|nr:MULTISPECIES: chromate efflux transporter [Qipengyuania]MBY6015661.1 chromate efflux transporter [Qipengyuania gaetbuli]MDG5746773.1 chromate efflux transporter [Qipengyuania sp. XHP0207]